MEGKSNGVSTNVQPAGPSKALGLIAGLIILALLAYSTNYLGKHVHKALEYPIWAVALGLTANVLLTLTRTKDYITPAIRTELFLKTGLVLLGAGINITEIASVGGKGIVQAIIMVTSVFFFTWWLGGVFKLNSRLKAVMSTAISICGVSAAIAAAGSVLARKEELTYITALVILTALPLMVLMPYAAGWLGLTPQVAGAWFGGNIDTTAAVVGAGAIYGEQAMKVASIVKMSQNALIGIAAFLLAVYWVVVGERKSDERPGARVIWDRFPKFVLGFVLTSILASLGFFSKAQLSSIKALQTWAFALAFICIGLELSFKQFGKLGVKPTAVYLIATVFNTLLALGIGFLIFGGLFGI